MKKIGKYSIGTGDRFGQQGYVQLSAIIEAEKNGIEITPVWNKSNREHLFTGTKPEDVRFEAESAVAKAGYGKDYFVDADHINIETAGRFISSSDFFTIDVASCIGKRAQEEAIKEFTGSCKKYFRGVKVPGIKRQLNCSEHLIGDIAEKYLYACIRAGEIYRFISGKKGQDNMVTEVSIDEVAIPQSPVEIFFILKMLSEQGIRVQTIAPKFSGRFNKGVDYSGDPEAFASEFESDLLVAAHAAAEFGLPENLKLSIHSGSDKFSIYPYIRSLLAKHNKGIHLKTAGTTWLEEVAGLAMAGGEGLEFVKEIYISALSMLGELCAPYSDVISIRHNLLPSDDEVRQWNGHKFASSVRHNISDPDYNSDMRQLMHIAYKLAARDMQKYLDLLKANRDIISKGVFDNLYNKHISKVFPV